MNELLAIVQTSVLLGAIAFVLGLVLFIASKVFAVEEDPLIEEVIEALPSANCGGCGFPGCRGFAEALVNTRDDSLYCPPGGNETAEVLALMLDMSVQERERYVARVYCQGGEHAARLGDYQGIATCAAISQMGVDDLICPVGCLGYADCVLACEFDALHIIKGVAVVNEDKCTACGECVPTCPKDLIDMVPVSKIVYVACKSTDAGGLVRKYCTVGCTACKLCVKACQDDAIFFDNNLASVIYDNCTFCNSCVTACKTDTIVNTARTPLWKSEWKIAPEKISQETKEKTSTKMTKPKAENSATITKETANAAASSLNAISNIKGGTPND